MAVNTFKNKKNEQSKSSSQSLFKTIEGYLKIDGIFEHGLPVTLIPKILYLSFLTILYIANSHFSDKTTRKLDKVKTEVEEMRVEYTTLKAEYMKASMQSEVARNVAQFGLEESSVPPHKIVIEDSEY